MKASRVLRQTGFEPFMKASPNLPKFVIVCEIHPFVRQSHPFTPPSVLKMFGKPSKKKFAKQLAEAIQGMNGGTYEFDADQFMLVRQDAEGIVNLSNLYQEHCSLEKEEREEHLLRIASIFGGSQEELPESFEEVKSHLRPKIWNRATFEFMELQRQLQGGEKMDIPLYPVGSHLYASIVYDTEHAMRSISNEELSNWGVSYYEAQEIACENLQEDTMMYAQMGDHFHSSLSGDNYDSARILLIDQIKNFSVLGETIAAAPQRDAMYVAGSDDAQSLKIMLDFIKKTMEEDPRPLSPLPLRLVDDQWVDWEPPKNHAVRPQYDDLLLHHLGGLYADQKELLEKIYEPDPQAPFVASFSALQERDTEEVKSYCAWTKGIESLLPKTNLIMLGDESGTMASGPWNHIQSIVGDLMTEDESFYPVRYRVNEFPSEQQLTEIGNTLG